MTEPTTSGAVPVEFLRGVIALCTQRGYSPENIEAWSTDDKWIADLWRQAARMLAAAPAQPAAEPANSAAYAALEKKHNDFLETVGLMLDAIGYTEDYARQWPKEKASVTFKRWFDEKLASHGQAPAGATLGPDAIYELIHGFGHTTHAQSMEMALGIADLSPPSTTTQPAPQQEAHNLAQALTDRENQPNQYGVEFGMSGTYMHFKIGNQLFKLAYEPDEQEEFDFMKRMLVNAFTTFTNDVKTAHGDELSDAVRVPLHSLHADAAYLIVR